MNIWNKVLVGFIIVLSPVSLYLAVRAMRTHRHWRKIAVQMEADLKDQIEENAKLIDGTGEGEGASMGTRRAALELHKMMVDRGRVWYNCQPMQVQVRPDPATGRDTIEGVKLATTLPEPNGISTKTVLYLFEHEETRQGACYLGQFTVIATAADSNQLQLLPSMNLSPEQQKRLTDSQQSRTPWTLYETMPIDDHAAFAGMSEAEIKTLVGSDIVAKKLADPQRPLHDYEALFRDFHRQRSIRLDMFAAATRDKQFMDEATADATEQEQFRRHDIDQLKTELTEVTGEANTVIAHRNEVKNKLAAVKAAAEKLIQDNQAMAGEIARIQLEATRLIDERTRDERTRSMAQLAGSK